MDKIKKDIIEHIGVLSVSKNGWQKELNIVSWNERTAKYDIREWDSEHEKTGKGITLNDNEYRELVNLILEREN